MSMKEKRKLYLENFEREREIAETRISAGEPIKKCKEVLHAEQKLNDVTWRINYVRTNG